MIGTTDYIEYRSGFKYQLATDYYIVTECTGYNVSSEYIQLLPTGEMLLKHGYATDGPSGLTIDTRNSIRASFGHDAFYWLIRNKFIDMKWKSYADKLFLQQLLNDGMAPARAWLWYVGVTWKGAESLYPSKERPILRSP